MVLLALVLQLTLAAPQPVAEIDTGKLKGNVTELAWSVDGSEFYVQTTEHDRVANRRRHGQRRYRQSKRRHDR